MDSVHSDGADRAALTTFEADLMTAVRRVVIQKISDPAWLELPYNKRIILDRNWLQSLYSRVDMQRISDLVLARVEERIADKIFNALATELATDTKSVMCDQKARDAFRSAIRGRIAAISVPAAEAPDA